MDRTGGTKGEYLFALSQFPFNHGLDHGTLGSRAQSFSVDDPHATQILFLAGIEEFHKRAAGRGFGHGVKIKFCIDPELSTLQLANGPGLQSGLGVEGFARIRIVDRTEQFTEYLFLVCPGESGDRPGGSLVGVGGAVAVDPAKWSDGFTKEFPVSFADGFLGLIIAALAGTLAVAQVAAQVVAMAGTLGVALIVVGGTFARHASARVVLALRVWLGFGLFKYAFPV